jgi:hypothetical protein
MNDPHLLADEYLKDRIRSRETVFQPRDFAFHTNTPASECCVTLTGSSPLRISLPCGGFDFSSFNRLVLTVCNLSEEPVLAGMTLNHGASANTDRLRPVSFSGGREILQPGLWEEIKFPIECFGFYGKPCGWSEVRGIELTFAREKGRKEAGELRIALRSLVAEAREVPPGPRLTARGLDRMLGTDFGASRRKTPPEDEPGGFSNSTGDSFRFPGPYHPGNSAMLIPPPHPYPCENAEAVLAGHIMGQGVPKPISWDFNPLGAQEWTHFLNRHHFLRELVVAFARTGEPRYAEELDRLISSWIVANPVPLESNGGAGPAWETLSTAWRLREWLWVAGVVWPSGSFSGKTRDLMLRSLWEHARSLTDHRGHPGNWVLVEAAALALAGICFPAFRDAPVWAAEGVSRLGSECEKQFLADGSHCEMSPLYHAICLHAVIEVKEAANAAGCRLPDLFDELPAHAAEYLAALARPDFSWPSLNDSGGVQCDYTALLRKAGELFGRDDFLWIGTRGREGTPPEKRSQIFPDAGVAVVRTGGSRRSNFLVFRAGPSGTAHRHEDVLALDVTALGISRLVDPGITTYAPGPLTSWYRSKGAHNVLLVDPGKRIAPPNVVREFPQTERPHLLFRRHDLIEAAIGTLAGTGETAGLMLSRSVVFVHGQYWIVRDFVSGPPDGEVSTCWQFYPGGVEQEPEIGALRCMTSGGPGFELRALPGPVRLAVEVNEGALDPPCGWVSIDGRDVPAPHFRCRWKTSFPATVLWLLLPYEDLTKPPGSDKPSACGDDAFVTKSPPPPFRKGGRDEGVFRKRWRHEDAFGRGPAPVVEAERTDQEDGTVRLRLIFPTGCSDAITFRPPAAGQRETNSRGEIEFTRQHGNDSAYNAVLVF